MITNEKNKFGNGNRLIEDIRDKMDFFYSLPDNSKYNFERLIKFISENIGIELSYYRKNYIHRRIYYRINRLNLKTYKEYLSYLVHNPKEIQIFKDIFTIHVTEFFRDTTPFRFIEDHVLIEIAKKKKNKSEIIKILCAPCSTGEEAYSLAIICNFLKKKAKITNPIEIHACDIDKNVVEFAKTGIYPIDTMKNISKKSLITNFNIIENNSIFEAKQSIKKYVSFFVHNLLKPLPKETYDLITCRNFLIYVSKPHQKIVIDNLSKNLRDKGFLMLGKTEGFPLLSKSAFSPINIREHIYQYHKE